MARAKVLIVEDEALVARNIQDKLQELGYTVPTVVDSGAAAVEQAGELRPDLVLMDIRLRGEIDGIQAAAQISEQFDIPVIYLTAYSDDETLQRAKVTEPFGYIIKPFRASELHSLVEMALYRHVMERRLRESEARYRSVVEDQTEFIVRWLRDGTRTFVNQSYCTHLGITPDEALATSIFSSIPEAHHVGLQSQIDAVTLDSPSWLDEWCTEFADGRMAWTQWTHRGLFDERGQLLELQSVGRDITEEALRKAKEAADRARLKEGRRRQEAERRRQIAESLGDVLAALNSDESLDDVLDLIAMHTRRLLDTDAVVIFRRDGESGPCAIQAAQGLPAGFPADAISLLGNKALRQALSLQQAVSVPDMAARLASDDDQPLGVEDKAFLSDWSQRYHALLAVPVLIKDEIYGGMLLFYTSPRALSDEDAELADLFGTQVALAVENARLRREAEQSAVAAERNRLARELHDAVTQSLFSASLIAEVMPLVWERNLEEGRRGLEELRRLTQGALAEMRTLLLELRPASLTEQSLGLLIRRLAEAMAARTRMVVTATVTGDRSLPADVHIALYRIAQEALTNIGKHARATRANVSLQCEPDRVSLHISDDGRGFDPATPVPHHLGMEIMRERAQAIGASFKIESQPGQGTALQVLWPAPRPATRDILVRRETYNESNQTHSGDDR
jgi:PAS domain S-box-containing protein